jgi:farnesyl diphosphate synthase
MDRYKRIIRYKTAYYSFLCPMVSGMLLAEWDDPVLIGEIEDILLNVGEYFQIQDDYLDCYGDESKTGKVGTDIQDGKCTWLLIKALEKASPDQRKALQENIGSKEPEKVAKVKGIYDALRIPAVYAEFEENAIAGIQDAIRKCRAGEPVGALLLSVVALISKRQS